MYRIMLADDEGIVIESLRFMIEKEFGDDCEIKFAKTGRSVIELAESFRPDIAIMDIQMPGINGIDAMKEIKKVNSNIIFIVMTAYDKFDYAKEAINLGVLDYLNKPARKDVVISVLRRAMDTIDADRRKRSEDLIIKEKMETVVPIIENGLIQNLLSREHFEDDINNYKNLLGIKENYGYMAVIIAGDEQVGNRMTGAVAAGIRMQNVYQEIRMLVEEYEILPLQVGYDRYSSQYLVKDMKSYGFHMDDVYQGYNLTPAINEMEGMLRNGDMRLGNNALLQTHILNTALKMDTESKRVKIIKMNNKVHIDCVAALLCALIVKSKYYETIGEQLKNYE